jgi:O-succinylbenzoic acid--CoA ligase
MPIEPLAIPTGDAVLGLLPRLREALAGNAPIRPYAASAPVPASPPTQGLPADSDPPVPGDLAVVVGTSGSTGSPKLAMLTAAALTASAAATDERLGGGGQWLLAVPAHHIAGLQVLLRSVHAGTTPVVMDLADSFTPARFAAAAARLDPALPTRTSLVPTQVTRLLDDPAGRAALARVDAVLVGGSAVPALLRERASEAGVNLVATYGMSETGGGCVYNGRALSGVTVRIAPDGRVELGGATLASGYLGDPGRTTAAFPVDPDGTRWLRTDDAGHLAEDGRLVVDGRLDDLVNTGGLKVAPRLVEDALLASLPQVREAVVVGVPDATWGQTVAAALVLRDPGHPLTGPDVRAALRGILPDHALPQRILVLPTLPLAGPGKPDRRAIAGLLAMGE